MENNEEIKPTEELQPEEELKPVEELKDPEETKEEPKTEMTPVEEEPSAPVEEKKKKKKGPLIVVLLVLLIVIAVCVYKFVLPNLNNETTTEGQDKVKVSSYRLSGNGLDDFDLYFLQAENNANNNVYSPLSIKYALAMLNEGAAGTTKEQISSVIGDYKAKKYPNSEHMSFANAMYIRDSFKDQIKDEYTKTLKDKYNAEVMTDPFTSPKPMNEWISNKTFGLVDEMLSEEQVEAYNFILVNALAIDMNWKNQIHCTTDHKIPCLNNGIYSVTYKHEKMKGEDREYSDVSYPYMDETDFPALKFNGKDNYKSATVLADFNRYDAVKEIGEDKIREIVGKEYQEWLKDPHNEEWARSNDELDVDKYLDKFIQELNENYGKEMNSTDFMLYEDDDVKTFAKDLQEYDGVTLQYVGIMPKTKDLESYVKDLKAEDVSTIISNLKELKKESFKEGVATVITGQIPMFKYDSELDLNKDLEDIGITDIFNIKKSNLSNMLKDEKQVIDASHKATIEFSNDGIKAAAVTAMGGMGSATGGFNYLFEVPVERIDITFDKPYMYIIRDKASGEVWFVGSVYEPVQK